MKDLLPILAALAVLLGVAFAAAVGVVVLSSGSCSPSARQVAVVLVYQPDPQPASDSGPIDMEALAAAVDRRLNRPGYTIARVRHLGDQRIEVGVFDSRSVPGIERLLGRPGTLEFRILANQNDHPSLIQRARSEDGSVLDDPGGSVQAWWVPVPNPGILATPEYTFPVDAPSWESATRTRQQGQQQVTEALVVNDAFDVTGDYLERAEAAKDEFGTPCVEFFLNREGATRLGGLTNDNLPDGLQAITRRLAIIVDGQLCSAPAIQYATFERGQITDSFSRQEVEDLVQVLNAGPLPARLTQVEKRTVGAEP